MGILERKEREKEQRKIDIIDAAEKVFFSKGFDNASMNDVANQAELSKGTLYLYFESKNELCMAIIVRSLEKIYEIFQKVTEKNCNGLKKLQFISEEFLNFTIEHPQYYKSLLTFRNHSIECAETGKIYQASLKKNAEINRLIEKIIVEGQGDNSISITVDAVKLAQAIWGNLTGFLPGCVLAKNQMNKQADIEPSAVLRYIFELIQNAIKAQ